MILNEPGAARPSMTGDEGFSLPELAIYVALLGIIATIVAASVLGLFRSERTVSGLTDAANQSQIFVSIINQDLRSAREFAVRDGGATLVASVAGKTTPITWSCVTWAVIGSGADREIRRNGATLIDHVQPRGTDPFFAVAAAMDVPQGKEGTLIYTFLASDAETGTVTVDGTVSMEAQGTLGSPAHCI